MAAFQTLLGLGTVRKPTSYKQVWYAADLSKPPVEGRTTIYWGLLNQPDKQKLAKGCCKTVRLTP